MAELTQEIYEALPEAAKVIFEKSGDVYIPISEGKLRALKEKMDDLGKNYAQANSRIQEIERNKAAEIEQARIEALKTAVTKGDAAEVERRYQEQMADLERRTTESLEQERERSKRISGMLKTRERSLIVNEVAKELNILDGSAALFSRDIQNRIDVDPETGKVTFLGEDGSATSLDKAGFVAELAKNPVYDPLRKATVATGGLANGSSSVGGALKNPHEYTEQERAELYKRDPAKFHELFPTS